MFNTIEIETVQELWDEYLELGAEGSGYHFWVEKEGGVVRGFVCFGPRALTQGTYDLYWIAVDPAAQGFGVGKKLLAETEKQISLQGGRLMILETSGLSKYEPTRGFYLKSGYILEATIRNFYAPGDDLVIFTKDLTLENS
jgi:ribosomal protein S18 acetylase RimI-like enzyme